MDFYPVLLRTYSTSLGRSIFWISKRQTMCFHYGEPFSTIPCYRSNDEDFGNDFNFYRHRLQPLKVRV